MDEFLKIIIPLFFVAVAVVNGLLRKKKEKEERQNREQTSAAQREDDTEEETMYSASQDDIRAFLEQVSGLKPEEKPKPEPPPMPEQAAPAAKRKRKKGVSPGPRKAIEAPRSSERIERRMPADVFLREAPKEQEIDMSGRIAHLPPMQQAILWHEILGPPPGLPESRSERKG